MTSGNTWADLILSEGPRLQRFLRRLGPTVSAEDVAQDTFIRLFDIDISQISSPRAYLFRTARNLALNTLRRESSAPIASLPTLDRLQTPSSFPNPEDALCGLQLVARLRQAIDTLPAAQREALILFRIEGWSRKEIGAHLGVSHRTVERYVADALAHCHLALSKD